MAFNEGQAPLGILERALTGNIFVEQNLAFMNEGNKDGYNVYKYDIQNVLSAAVANPTFGSASDQANYKRSLGKVQSNEKFDPAVYESYWLEYQPSGLFQWEELPSQVQATLENLFLGSTVEATEDLLINGDGTVANITGIYTQLLSSNFTSLNGAKASSEQIVDNTAIAFRAHDAGSNDNLAVVLTTTNIFSKLEILIRNQTTAMRKRAGRKFMVSPATIDIIGEAQRLELNFKGVDVTEAGVLRYAGYDILECASFPDNAILFCSMTGDMKTDAIQLGTSMSADMSNLYVDRISNFSREYGMLLTFALDIFAARPEEICFYAVDTVA